MNQEDRIFLRQFGAVLGILVAITVIIFFTAILTSKLSGPDPEAARKVAARIEPIGTVNISGEPFKVSGTTDDAGVGKQQAAAQPVASGAQATSGEATYQSACATCHATGVAGAPKLEDSAAWQARIAQGTPVLYQSALQGKGAMPAKGGRPDLAEPQIKAAVDYMVSEVH